MEIPSASKETIKHTSNSVPPSGSSAAAAAANGDSDDNDDNSVSIPTTTVALEEIQGKEALASSSSHVRIALDAAERALFRTLQETAQAYNAGRIALSCDEDGTTSLIVRNGSEEAPNHMAEEPLVFRVAGGWVRDKLLRLETHDVDVAVNTLTGAQAARLVKEYLQWQKTHHSTAAAEHVQTDDEIDTNSRLAIPPPPPLSHRSITAGRIGVIAANPAQSKHLETATVKIAGIDVDFCNLRGDEVYAEHSRIPSTQFGTPRQDAMRRDFTLNALFYNLTTQTVEDWTRRGWTDLQACRLVTPLDPVVTFRDDPLRVLRAIRFAVRYQLGLDPALQAAAQDVTIHQALHVKVSRERVGKELEGMLSGKGANAVLALETIEQLHLAGSVFKLPIVGQDKVTVMHGHIAGQPYTDVDHNGVAARHVRELGWQASARLLQVFVQVQRGLDERLAATTTSSSSSSSSITYNHRLVAVAAYLLPFRKLWYREKKKKRDWLAVTYVFREGIKFKNADVTFITRVMETLDDMLHLLSRATAAAASSTAAAHPNATNQQQQQQMSPSPPLLLDRLETGLVLQSIKELWVSSLLLATVVKLGEQQQEQQTNSSATPVVDWIHVAWQVYQAIVVDLKLQECWKLKPLLNGRALIDTLRLPQGPLVRTYHEEQMKWMLQNPSGSAAECQAHLVSFKRKLEQTTSSMNDNHPNEEEEVVGMSDGTGKTPSSPLHHGSASSGGPGNASSSGEDHQHAQHFSKKMHVESMELS